VLRHNPGVQRREREQILGEWGVREGTALDVLQRRRLERDVVGADGERRAVSRRLRNFRPAVDRYVTSLGGPLPYMVRLRQIHDETLAHEERLERAWLELAADAAGDADLFARRWRALAVRWNFAAVNELIERHNRYYPAESNLPMDPTTGDFVLVGGKPYRKQRLDAAWVLERFPPLLARAAA
jgi:hypothetical protein